MKTLLRKLWTIIKPLPLLAMDGVLWLVSHYVMLLAVLLTLLFGKDWWAIMQNSLDHVQVLLDKDMGTLTDEEWKALRFLPLGIAAFASVLFVLVRMYIAQKVAQTGDKNHLSQRFISAVEQLGAEKTVKKNDKEHTTPNLEVRLGAIHTLEALMKDSRRDYWPAVESLTAYLRENGLEDVDPMPGWNDEDIDGSSMALEAWTCALPKPNSPRQAAATALARRGTWARMMMDREEWRTTPRPLPLARLDLRNMDLVRAQFRGADLSGAQLQGAELSGAQLQRADFSWAQLQNANLYGAQLQKADLSGAQLQKADLSWAQLQKADLRGAQLQKADLSWAQLQKANLSGAQLQKAYLSWAELQKANLSGAQLQKAYLVKAQLQEADFSAAQLQKANLFRAQLQKADLRKAQLQKANLSGAQLQRANLSGAQLQRADLSGAQLQGANLCGADMTDATGLTQDQINSAFGDAATKLPEGLTRPSHWADKELELWEISDAHQTWLKSRDRP
ncbi:MAG: pentapeptide repeat-containing protein [Planktomarina sp.]